MVWLKRIGGAAAAVAVLALLAAGIGYTWARSRVAAVLDQTWETHTAAFPVPWPLSDAEKADLAAAKRLELGAALAKDADPLAGVDLDAIALERAQARGKHYTEAVFVCAGCHGADFTGGWMIHDDMIGHLQGPNITRGGTTRDFSPADWDRAVRHGVLPGGKTSIMPVTDFRDLSDHELSDIVAYIGSVPPKPAEAERRRDWGPIGTILIATGQLQPDVTKIADHQAAHRAEPPPIGPTAEYGAHIATICMNCHRDGLNGGPMPFGPPDWPPAANLTPTGMPGWTFDEFKAAFQMGKKRDGTPMRVPMSEMLPFSARMTDDEIQALWAYLKTVPAAETGD